MGIYSEYLDRGQSLDLNAERKKELSRIASLRNRDILVYASDSNKAARAPVALDLFGPTPDQRSTFKFDGPLG